MTRLEMVETLRGREDDAARAWESANVQGDKRAAQAAKRRFMRAVATRRILEAGYTIRIRTLKGI